MSVAPWAPRIPAGAMFQQVAREGRPHRHSVRASARRQSAVVARPGTSISDAQHLSARGQALLHPIDNREFSNPRSQHVHRVRGRQHPNPLMFEPRHTRHRM